VSETPLPRFYQEMASWWPLMSAVEDYREEAGFYGDVLAAAGDAPSRTLLELGSGGGNNACFMKQRFQMTLVEPAAGMLEHSRRLNPECEHVQGDMRNVRLERQFDRVFVHDAVVYMTTAADLRAAIETVWLHCRPGGAALLAPDYVTETFRPGTDCGGHDDGPRGLRYLEWMTDPDPSDTSYRVDYAFLLREGDRVHVEHDRHIEGLFPREEWLRMLREVGFEASVQPLVHSEVEAGAHEVFVAVRPR
jgi:SAM-dependent methyltransferase